MTGLLVVLIPLLLLFFMFAMQSIESSLLNTPDTTLDVAGTNPTESTGTPLPNESAPDEDTPPKAQAA